jgi:hypothetical protein
MAGNAPRSDRTTPRVEYSRRRRRVRSQQHITIDTALAAGATRLEHASGPWQSVLPSPLKATHDSLASGADRAARVVFVNRVVPLGTRALDLDALRSLGDRVAAAGAYFCPTLQVVEGWRVSPPSLPNFSPENAQRYWNGFADVATRITQVVAERGVKLLIGQDGFAPGGTVREMEVLVAAGPASICRSSTSTARSSWLSRPRYHSPAGRSTCTSTGRGFSSMFWPRLSRMNVPGMRTDVPSTRPRLPVKMIQPAVGSPTTVPVPARGTLP